MHSDITPEQAIAAVRAAGLDPDRSLSEQLAESPAPSESTVRGWVSEAVAQARPPSPEEQQLRFAESLRDKLNESTSQWFSLDGRDAA